MLSIYNNGKTVPNGIFANAGKRPKNFEFCAVLAAGAIELCLFRDGKESRFAMSRTDNIWHVWAIEGVGAE